MGATKWIFACSAMAVLAVLSARQLTSQGKSIKAPHLPALTPGSIFIFGLGYTGERFAKFLLQQGWKVWGTVRSEEAYNRLTGMGIACVMLGEAVPLDELCNVLQSVTHILVTAAPTDNGDPMLAKLAVTVHSLKKVQWVGYLSTVGVYGDTGGQVVDEKTPVNPLSQRAKRRVQAEQQWLDTGLPVHIFRLPGIYGPNRGPLEKVRDGSARRVLKEGHVFSRIHVDDICIALAASMARPRPGAVYNVVDDEPAPGHVVTEYACRLLGAQVPPLVDFEKSDMTPMARSFYSESRYMVNDLIKQELGVQMRYPTYREGLQAQLAEERRNGLRGPRAATLRRVWWYMSRFFARPNAKPKGPANPTVILADNGSLRAASTLSLRKTAAAIESALRTDPSKPVRAVYATSVRFSDRIDANLLEGRKAVTTAPFIKQLLLQGERRFVLLPFFLGPSSSVYSEIVRQLRFLKQEHPDMDVDIAPPLVCRCPFLFPSPKWYGDDVIATILFDNAMDVINQNNLQKPAVIMVDHGSPQPAVGRVRGYVATKLAPMLEPHVSSFVQSSMERRDGPEYDFNDPLLKDVLDREDYSNVDVVVALMFLNPGKHAGPDGDIAQIIKSSKRGGHPGVFMTDVLGSHPKLLPLLVERYRQALPLDILPELDDT